MSALRECIGQVYDTQVYWPSPMSLSAVVGPEDMYWCSMCGKTCKLNIVLSATVGVGSSGMYWSCM